MLRQLKMPPFLDASTAQRSAVSERLAGGRILSLLSTRIVGLEE